MSSFDLNAGATAPLSNEIDLMDLPVEGALPPELGRDAGAQRPQSAARALRGQ